jgi:hypothetical protein
MKLIKANVGGYVWLYGPKETTQKFCGGILEAMSFGQFYLEIPNEELVWGVSDMVKNNNDIAEFGEVAGIFLFSRKGDVA